jgi:hypothetical protein
MQRTILILAALLAATSLSTAGCRSCSSCYDYSPPVADCDCNTTWTQRAGSASGGYVASPPYADGESVETAQ